MAQNVIGSQQSTIDTQTQNPTIPSPSPIPQQLPVINNLNPNPNPNVSSFQIQPLQHQVAVQQAGLYGGLMNFGGSAVVPAQQQQLAGSVGVGVGGNASNLSAAGPTQFNLLTTPAQKVGLVQTSQFSSVNSAGQSLQGMQQAIRKMESSNLASQLMTTNRALYGQKQQPAQQALLNNQQNGQAATILNQLLKQIPAVSGTTSLLPLQQPQRQQQLASSAQPQQSSLTLNQQQFPQLMQQPKPLGQPQLQQQLQHQQQLQLQLQIQQQYQRLQQQQLALSAQLQQSSLTMNQQQLLPQQRQQLLLLQQQQQLVLQQQQQQTQLLQQQLQALRMPGPTGQKSLSLTELQPDATAFGMTTPGGSSSEGTRTNVMSGQTEIMSIVRELKETRKEVKAIIKILLKFFKVISIVMALFIFVTLFVVLTK